jgi:hypothetical protein
MTATQLWPIFICYRQVDGSAAARRLHEMLDKWQTTGRRMNTPEHGFVGPRLHDRIIGALELCCRRGEMLLIQNKRICDVS